MLFRPHLTFSFQLLSFIACLASLSAQVVVPVNAPPPSALNSRATVNNEEVWSLHAQNTIVIQNHPAIRAKYSGLNSLDKTSETHETVSFDLLAGLRLWEGAELHLDGLVWEGYGLSNALGIAAFPNGEAFRKGTATPNGNIVRAFIRQSIGFGTDVEDAPAGALFLKGRQHVNRLTFTLGRMSAKDIFDSNAYSNDARTQFMNWSLMANSAWDYPADSLGFTTGGAVELYVRDWALRYGFFQVPGVANGIGMDAHIFKAWAQVMELEHKHEIDGHPGAVRLLAYMNRAHMGSFSQTLNNPARPADITTTREYRIKYGFGLNADQEIANGVGVFTRLGWSNGAAESWSFTDVDRTATFGISAKGEAWKRPADTLAVACIINSISKSHSNYHQQGGTGILVGDGTLSYGAEKVIETYYDIAVRNWLHLALDYQLVMNPAYNRDRGPVNVFGARMHWEF